MSTKYTMIAVVLFSGLVLSCSDDSSEGTGIDRAKKVSTLSASEGQSICSWSVELQGGAGTTHDCGEGVTVEIDPPADCVASLAGFEECGLTVGQFEDCNVGMADKPCSFGGEACKALVACFQ